MTKKVVPRSRKHEAHRKHTHHKYHRVTLPDDDEAVAGIRVRYDERKQQEFDRKMRDAACMQKKEDEIKSLKHEVDLERRQRKAAEDTAEKMRKEVELICTQAAQLQDQVNDWRQAAIFENVEQKESVRWLKLEIALLSSDRALLRFRMTSAMEELAAKQHQWDSQSRDNERSTLEQARRTAYFHHKLHKSQRKAQGIFKNRSIPKHITRRSGIPKTPRTSISDPNQDQVAMDITQYSTEMTSSMPLSQFPSQYKQHSPPRAVFSSSHTATASSGR